MQGVELDSLDPQRILFGFFPTYRQSPLRPAWDRILQVSLAPPTPQHFPLMVPPLPGWSLALCLSCSGMHG